MGKYGASSRGKTDKQQRGGGGEGYVKYHHTLIRALSIRSETEINILKTIIWRMNLFSKKIFLIWANAVGWKAALQFKMFVRKKQYAANVIFSAAI